MRIVGSTALSVFTLVAACLASVANAAPPAHAPAHGWRAKHAGHSGYQWEQDFGIRSGQCNREAVATVLGSMAGALIGNRVADSEDRAVATVVGALAGALVGNRIGRKLDAADQACFGHALELGESGQTVQWSNDSATYRMIPGADRERNGSACREFSLHATVDSEQSVRQGLACQSERGVWEIVQ